jgi:SM-20-related protein
MRSTDSPARFGLFIRRGFLDAATCAAIRSEARSAPGNPAPVYIEGSPDPIDETIRKTTSVQLSDATFSFVHQRLREQRLALGEHFCLKLTDCERPQILLYRVGDFFVRHQDGNTEQLDFDHLRVRKISVVVFLNGTSATLKTDTFRGGSLVFYRANDNSRGEPQILRLRGETGLLVAFPADTVHEVTPVTQGERFTIISWFR